MSDQPNLRPLDIPPGVEDYLVALNPADFLVLVATVRPPDERRRAEARAMLDAARAECDEAAHAADARAAQLEAQAAALRAAEGSATP